MATATTAPKHHDIPFTVQDRRRKGFFMVDNELLDHYGFHLGPYGLAVYIWVPPGFARKCAIASENVQK